MKKFILLSLVISVALTSSVFAQQKKLVLVAGRPSHGPGQHEFNAGTWLLKKCLDENVPQLETVIVQGGWPEDTAIFDDADAILFYMDGGGGHPAIQQGRLEYLKGLVEKGVGIGHAHYSVEVPAGEAGDAWKEWIGGYYETNFSANPIWTPDFGSFVDHPVTQGVRPFSVEDEWYISMRFRPERRGVVPLLVATPSDDVRDGPYVSPRGPYQHLIDNTGRPEVMMWAVEREDGGRGFGFTGGHNHVNWGNDDYRKIFLNALLWIAKVEVPENGVESIVTAEDLTMNLDPKGRGRGRRGQ